MYNYFNNLIFIFISKVKYFRKQINENGNSFDIISKN